ncbi:hypothetical protein D3C78_793220 [compost metagenome]
MIGLDEVEAGQFVVKALHQLGVYPLLLPLRQHGRAHGIRAQGAHVVHRDVRVGPRQVDGGVEGVPSKVAHYVGLVL